MPKTVLAFLLVNLVSNFAVASTITQQGDVYGYWGWNRATYADSDIHFSGEGHDFTLYDVQAKDRQNPLTFKTLFSHYLNPLNITIPQYNYRFGYFVTDNIAISLGWDHMKYVVQNGQTVKMEGYIETSMSAEHAKPENTGRIDKTLSTDFLMFEHTDGFNTITLEGEYFYSLWQNEKGFDVAVFGGGGAGIVVPRSAVKLTNKALHDEWHWAGVAGAGKFGLEVTGWQRYFVRSTVKVGYANMYDVLTTHDGGRADHGIGYVQYIGAIGVRF